MMAVDQLDASCPHEMHPAACLACRGELEEHVPRSLPPRSGVFEARYRGTCASCGLRITPGALVRYVENLLIHRDCEG